MSRSHTVLKPSHKAVRQHSRVPSSNRPQRQYLHDGRGQEGVGQVRRGRDGDQVRRAALTPVDGVHQGLQHALVPLSLAEVHNVNVHLRKEAKLGY